jgi:hypothetical protein
MTDSPQFPPEFYRLHIFDATFDAWRSKASGHRAVNSDGTPVKSTRSLAWWRPWLGVMELYGRYVAREAGRLDAEIARSRG